MNQNNKINLNTSFWKKLNKNENRNKMNRKMIHKINNQRML